MLATVLIMPPKKKQNVVKPNVEEGTKPKRGRPPAKLKKSLEKQIEDLGDFDMRQDGPERLSRRHSTGKRYCIHECH